MTGGASASEAGDEGGEALTTAWAEPLPAVACCAQLCSELTAWGDCTSGASLRADEGVSGGLSSLQAATFAQTASTSTQMQQRRTRCFSGRSIEMGNT